MSTQPTNVRSQREYEARQWMAGTQPRADGKYEVLLAEARVAYDDAVKNIQRFDDKADAWIRLLATLLAFAGAASVSTGLALPFWGVFLTANAWFIGICIAVYMRRSFSAPAVMSIPKMVDYLHAHAQDDDRSEMNLTFVLAQAYFVAESAWRDLSRGRETGNTWITISFVTGVLLFFLSLSWRAAVVAASSG